MCKHCDSLPRYIPAIARGERSALDLARVTLAEIRATHNYNVITRASRSKSKMADALRAVVSALWRFVGSASQANYDVISRSISAYYGATLRANDSTKERILNPQGKSEPKYGPQHFTLPPDSFVHNAPRYDPAHIIATVDHAQNQIARSKHASQRAARSAKHSTNPEIRALSRIVAHDYKERARNISASLAEYVSIYR